ncbi:MAG: DUF4405 domain-containing protein, partial [Balneolaceae bacterium]
YILPPGSGSANIWGLTRHEWGDIHFWIAVIFAVTITVHLILHLPWIKGSLFPSSTKKVRE